MSLEEPLWLFIPDLFLTLTYKSITTSIEYYLIERSWTAIALYFRCLNKWTSIFKN